MRKVVLAFLTVVSLFSFSNAKNHNLGIGVVFGAPSGVGIKYWTGKAKAVDVALGWSLKGNGYYYMHTDYLYHNFKLLKPYLTKPITGEMPVYTGIGLRMRFGNGDEEIGIRIPLGITYLFGSLPLDIFAEIAPALNLLPDTIMYLDASTGIRYYF